MTDSKKPELEEIDCVEAINGLYAYLDGELNDAESLAKFEHHLDHCQACYSRTQLESALTQLIRKTGKSRSPQRLQSRLKNLLDDL